MGCIVFIAQGFPCLNNFCKVGKFLTEDIKTVF